MTLKLPLDICRQIDAADGWLELGVPLSANEELEQVPSEWKAHPEVLLRRVWVYAEFKKWEECREISNSIVNVDPSIPEGWINRSFALHEMKRTNEAFDFLLPAAEKFPKVWIIPCNLACYCCQTGRCPDAETWFKRAMEIDEQEVKKAAIDDPDLEPLWQSKSGSTWTAI